MTPKYLALATLAAAPSFAQVLTGNDLLQRITSDNPGMKSIALGYVGGVTDSLGGDVFCAPDGVTLAQAVDMVRKWLTDNPEHRHMSAAVLVAVILQRAWPCRKSPTPGSRPAPAPSDSLQPGKTL